MIWPDVPLTTYLAASTPAIKSADLNAIQAVIGQLWGFSVGTSQGGISEDFIGTSQVTPIVAGAGLTGNFFVPTLSHAVVNPSPGTGAADGDYGVFSVEQDNPSSGTAHAIINTFGYLVVSTRDFYFSTRFKISTARANIGDAGAGYGVLIGTPG